jgi:hypothetical protein
MDELRQRLAPLTDWIPDPYRDYLPQEGWWLVALVVALAALLLAGHAVRAALRGTWRALVGRWRHDWDAGLREDLSALPAANGTPTMCVYHVPAWVRLVVVAPVGKELLVDPGAVPLLLDKVVPGLGQVVRRDQPEIRVWPAPLSAAGFANAFHRCTPTGRGEGEATGWVMLAGRAQGGSYSLFVGLGVWASEPTTLGRMNLEPRQWLDVLRMQPAGVRP